MGAMGEIEPHARHTGSEQFFQCWFVLAAWTDRADDLCLLVDSIIHECTPSYSLWNEN